jgi:broad specificity phosphatase PhoE
MPNLILIKHAAPIVAPGVPSEEWTLSEPGKRACTPLAEAVLPYAAVAVVSSLEPKAAETGEILAARLGIPFETAEGLHEHDRSNVPHMPSRDFISLVELFFRKPTERVLGRESADEALERFERAVDDVLDRYSAQNVAVVSHGTVIALLLAEYGGGKGFELWRKMGLPSFAVVEMPARTVTQVVAKVGV